MTNVTLYEHLYMEHLRWHTPFNTHTIVTRGKNIEKRDERVMM